ncbi:DegT/DnrJ/EryC1/StrS family aminotransferase [Robertkochia sediminum]|uniref:DegT/DnrJ/EryC1/StrS family aminotransferase n=1 Tax=Robertkochia sediminum TaxID=2785326 RepID=UPI001931FE2B|nr:DegT/DnrJ/EryC1/StrS family aminotransferase [Robertkochia sediminum]MBL7473327.1 DegT/DnrJ/EryC1/StrS family aminotransferase [Robertkochia sediminum]
MPGFELFGDQEREEVNKVLDTGVLMRYGFDGMRKGQWKALELEAALCRRMEVNHAQLVSSGTAALTVALASAGVGAGDEVIMPTFTFVASFESVLAIGAVPVLVDIDDTLTLDPKAVAAAITPRTKVVMPVHMCGSMADLDALKELCDKHDILLIEDACQAIGGTYKGKPLGSIGDLGCFSFDYVKTITCGEGGALITNNETYKKHADHYSDHGHDHVGNDRGAESHPFLGYNYRISELNAAVGVAQIKRLDDFIAIQKEHYSTIRKALAGVEGVTFRRVPEGGEENYSFLNIFLPDEEMARKAHKALSEAGIDGCFYWFDNNWHYIKKWDHLKKATSLGKLPQDVLDNLPDHEGADFSASDHWMGRNISVLIKLGWDQETVASRASTMAEVLETVLKAG